MTKEEILKNSCIANTYENDTIFKKDALYAMQEYSQSQNSSLIKEVEELKRSLKIARACWGEEMDDRMKKESEISQLKEANNKLNYAMIEWDTTHPIEAENRELQRKIKELKEALERILKKLPDEDNLDYDPGDIINCIYEIASSATH